jgi:hypothetical protein
MAVDQHRSIPLTDDLAEAGFKKKINHQEGCQWRCCASSGGKVKQSRVLFDPNQAQLAGGRLLLLSPAPREKEIRGTEYRLDRNIFH